MDNDRTVRVGDTWYAAIGPALVEVAVVYHLDAKFAYKYVNDSFGMTPFHGVAL